MPPRDRPTPYTRPKSQIFRRPSPMGSQRRNPPRGLREPVRTSGPTDETKLKKNVFWDTLLYTSFKLFSQIPHMKTSMMDTEYRRKISLQNGIKSHQTLVQAFGKILKFMKFHFLTNQRC